MTISSAITYIHGGVDPDYQVISATEVYERGEEIFEQHHGPVIPPYLDFEFKQSKCIMAALFFSDIHGRKPEAGEVLRFEEVVESLRDEQSKLIPGLERAGARRLPHLPCPLKFENGKVFNRSADSKPVGEWVENHIADPRHWWASIERELGLINEEFTPEWRPLVSQVRFVENEEGVQSIEPAEV